MKTKTVLFVAFATLVFLISCNDDSNGPEEAAFDRSIMLISLADELIVPNLESLQLSVQDLDATIGTLSTAITEQNLISAQQAWLEAVIDFQHTSAFGFGPGSLPLGDFATVIGVFPANEQVIEQNIQNPDFGLAASFNTDVRGFYAIEYLLFDFNEDNNRVLQRLDADRIAYLQLISNEILTIVNGMVNEWKSGYRDTFISNDGTAAGSSVSLLYNSFVKDYENLKNFKVELPAGLTAGQVSSLPKAVEAYYSGISLDLIEEHFQNSKNIWLGNSRNGDDIVGFEEYLMEVVRGPELVETTKSAIEEIDQAIANIPVGRLSGNVDANEVAILRNKLQENTPNFKSSMSSLLGISITFNSGDGD